MGLVSANKVETNKYELVVKVDAEAFEAAVEKAYLKKRKKISVPGFRPGRAPRKIVERLYGCLLYTSFFRCGFYRSGSKPIDGLHLWYDNMEIARMGLSGNL